MLHLAGGAIADDERTDVLWGRSLLRPVRRLPNKNIYNALPSPGGAVADDERTDVLW
jgi:hypothetical protein